jgi:capsid protein
VNYSSLRSGAIEERDSWKVIQDWFIENVMNPIFSEWLKWALLTGQIPLPYAGYNKFNAPEFRARGFDWVDPSKDIDADIKAINEGLETRSAVCARRGIDFEETLEELANEQTLIEKHKVIIASLTKPEPKNTPAPEPPKEPVKNADEIKELTQIFVNAYGQIVAVVKDLAPKENTAALDNFAKMHSETMTALEKIAGREIKLEPKMDVTLQSQPVTLDVKIEQQAPPVQPVTLDVKIEQQAPPVQPVNLDVHLHQDKRDGKKTFNWKEGGKIVKTVEMEG